MFPEQLPYEGTFHELAKFVRLSKCEESYYSVLIGAYMDESFDPKQSGMFVVGGVLGQGCPIFELERGWEKLLKRPDIHIAYFKASHCQNGWGEFAKFVVDSKNITAAERAKLDSISHDFLRVITHPVPYDDRKFLCIHGVGVIQEEFYEVTKDPKARAILGDSPYRLAYDFAMIQSAWAMKQLGDGLPKHCVSFVCDEDEEHSLLAEPAYRNLKQTNPNAAEYMASFSTVDEKTCAPVQAADAAVYEVRRALHVALKQRPEELRKQFQLLADEKAMFMISHTRIEQLNEIVATHKPGEPFRLDILMELQIDANIRF